MQEGASASTLPRAVLAGAALGFVETALVFGTGVAPARDVALVLGFDLLIGLVLGVLLAAARASPFQRDACLLLAPAALLGMRGNLLPALAGAAASSWLEWLSRVAPVALAALVAWRAHTRRSGLGSGAFFAACLALPGAAGVALVFRAVDFAESRNLALRDLASNNRTALILGLGLLATGFVLERARASVVRQRADGLQLIACCGAAILIGAWHGASPDLPVPRASANTPRAGAPDILLVVMDTVRRDHLSLHGYSRPTTPKLDAFAREATVFDDAYSNAPYTLAAHASLFTGKLPSRHGAHFVPFSQALPPGSPGHFALPAAEETLAERLRQRGYLTGALAANYALLAQWTGLLQGFDAFSDSPRRFWGYIPLAGSLAAFKGRSGQDVLPFRSTWGADRVSAAARAWLAVATGQPRFLFLNYMDAHDHRRLPPKPFDRLFSGPADSRREQSMARYDGRIRFLDEQLGELFDWLRAKGKLDEMLVIVTSDHGEFFGEHGRWGHGQAVYEEVLRVPLVVKLPYERRSRRVPERVSLAQVLGLIEAALTGRSGLEPVVSPEPVVAEHWVGRGEARSDGAALTRASYRDRFKLIERLGLPDMLFDLRADPREEADLFLGDPAFALAGRRETGWASLGPLEDLLNRQGTVVASDPGVAERLRSLGYLQ